MYMNYMYNGTEWFYCLLLYMYMCIIIHVRYDRLFTKCTCIHVHVHTGMEALDVRVHVVRTQEATVTV